MYLLISCWWDLERIWRMSQQVFEMFKVSFCSTCKWIFFKRWSKITHRYNNWWVHKHKCYLSLGSVCFRWNLLVKLRKIRQLKKKQKLFVNVCCGSGLMWECFTGCRLCQNWISAWMTLRSFQPALDYYEICALSMLMRTFWHLCQQRWLIKRSYMNLV